MLLCLFFLGVKCRTGRKVLFLNLRLGEMLASLSCSLKSIPFLTDHLVEFFYGQNYIFINFDVHKELWIDSGITIMWITRTERNYFTYQRTILLYLKSTKEMLIKCSKETASMTTRNLKQN